MLKRKVGNKVRIKSLDWYNKNKNKYGGVKAGDEVFVPEMSKHCGKFATVTKILGDKYYYLSIDQGNYCWTDEMLEDENPSYTDVWEFGNLFVIVNEKDKKIFPDFYITREEAEKNYGKLQSR